MKCHSSLHSIKQSKSLLLVNHSNGCLTLLAQKYCNQVPWFHSISIFQRLHFYFVLDCLAIYFECIILFMELQYGMFHGMSNRDSSRTAQWNSSGRSFHLKIDAIFYSCIISFILRYMFLWNEVVEDYIYRSSLTVLLLHFQGFCICYQVTLDLT